MGGDLEMQLAMSHRLLVIANYTSTELLSRCFSCLVEAVSDKDGTVDWTHDETLRHSAWVSWWLVRSGLTPWYVRFEFVTSCLNMIRIIHVYFLY